MICECQILKVYWKHTLKNIQILQSNGRQKYPEIFPINIIRSKYDLQLKLDKSLSFQLKEEM